MVVLVVVVVVVVVGVVFVVGVNVVVGVVGEVWNFFVIGVDLTEGLFVFIPKNSAFISKMHRETLNQKVLPGIKLLPKRSITIINPNNDKTNNIKFNLITSFFVSSVLRIKISIFNLSQILYFFFKT